MNTHSEASASRRPVDYSGRAIGPLRLARAMFLNILGGTFIAMALVVLWPNAVLTIIFMGTHLEATKTQIGLNFTLVIAATAASIPGAYVFSRLQRRKAPWIVLTVIARLFMFGPPVIALLAGHESWRPVLVILFMICLFLVNFGSVFTSPGWWAWMADLIPDAIRGTFFGRRYRWMLLGQSLFALAAGLMVEQAATASGERLLFFLAFALAAVLAVIDPLLFCFVPEPVRPPVVRRTLREVAREYLHPVRDPAFRGMLAGAGLFQFFYTMPLVFLILFLQGEQTPQAGWIGGRADPFLLSVITVVFAAGTALSANQWGRLADRIGHRNVWILGSLGFFTHISFFFINESNYIWLGLLNSALYGVFFSGQPVAVQNLALAMAPEGRREFYISMYQAVTALASALGPLAGGVLADSFRVLPGVMLPSGQPACYIHIILLVAFTGILASLPIMVRVPDPKGIPVRPWFGRLLSGDLWRMAWNISVLGTASGVPSRVRALRRISRRDGNLMLPEIQAALDDSDLSIRREALLALGRLGTPEACDLLLWYLHEPDVTMRADTVEAIGQLGAPDRSAMLRQALHDPDSRVRRAAVEALGRAGGEEATRELCRLLEDERDGEVLVSVAIALSRLKEFGAVRQMLELALYSPNTTVRAQMLVALADLLGESGEFHKLWRQDRHWRGSAFARLARRLRRQARVLARGYITDDEPRSRAERRRLLTRIDTEIENFLEEVQAEKWSAALDGLCRLALEFIILRYRYEGDERRAMEFLSAVAPAEAQRYWVLTYLRHVHSRGEVPEAPWDGLTLMATYILLHGQMVG